MKDWHIRTGRHGEQLAQNYLRSKGYSILETNFRALRGEIDIVARHKGDIVFVEVKTRKSDRYGAPAESVNWRKRMQLRKIARLYLAKMGNFDYPCRFDIVAITLENSSVELIQGAF